MKRLALIAAIGVCFCRMTADAQSFNFAGIAWGSSATQVRTALATQGLKFDSTRDGDLVFHGKLVDFPAKVDALLASGCLVKVFVDLLTPDPDAERTYRDMVDQLTKQYGKPKGSFRNFSYPFEDGDGHEETAIAAGKADISTFWAHGDEGLEIEISRELTVELSYESTAWGAEAERRKAASHAIFGASNTAPDAAPKTCGGF